LAYRVLIVDDYELWRRHVGSALRNDLRWQIVGEASDGLEAVEKAGALKPDLILLDVGLPTLTGIEAARRILALDPNARIVFLSEHRSWDIVQVALATSACGYIVKSDVGAELPSVLEAILDGRRFISASVVKLALTRATSEPFDQKTRRHEAVFHSDETSLLDDYARFAGSALEAGHAAIFIGNRSRREQIERRMQARGLDSDRIRKEGRYLPLDLEKVLSTFMLDGRFDDARFLSVATSLLMKAASAAPGERIRVAACGDGAWALWSEGRVEEAIRLEQLWDQLSKTYDIDVLCAYLAPAGGRDQGSDVFQRICAEHSSVQMR
jgi:DNA-binding NarL/FixJ family response regulator